MLLDRSKDLTKSGVLKDSLRKNLPPRFSSMEILALEVKKRSLSRPTFWPSVLMSKSDLSRSLRNMRGVLRMKNPREESLPIAVRKLDTGLLPWTEFMLSFPCPELLLTTESPSLSLKLSKCTICPTLTREILKRAPEVNRNNMKLKPRWTEEVEPCLSRCLAMEKRSRLKTFVLDL